jgi:hypothetical protein
VTLQSKNKAELQDSAYGTGVSPVRLHLTCSFLANDKFGRKTVDGGWRSYVHPEGALYFYHEATVSVYSLVYLPALTMNQRTYTSTNMYKEDLRDLINLFLSKIEQEKLQHMTEMPVDVECMLQLEGHENDTGYDCYYYLVDHANRVIFWMNEFHADEMIGEIGGVTDPCHMSTCSTFVRLEV